MKPKYEALFLTVVAVVGGSLIYVVKSGVLNTDLGSVQYGQEASAVHRCVAKLDWNVMPPEDVLSRFYKADGGQRQYVPIAMRVRNIAVDGGQPIWSWGVKQSSLTLPDGGTWWVPGVPRGATIIDSTCVPYYDDGGTIANITGGADTTHECRRKPNSVSVALCHYVDGGNPGDSTRPANELVGAGCVPTACVVVMGTRDTDEGD